MTTIKIMTCDQVLSFVETPVIACGDVKTVQMVTSTCQAWEGYALSAVFYTDLDKTPYEVLLTDGMCVVPHEVLSKCTTLHIGIRGVNDDEVKTSAILDYKIIEGTPSGIETTAEPTPSVYQQIITILNSTTKTADSAAEQAENNAETIEELQESVNNFTANNGTIQEVIDARTGSLVKHTFPNLSTRLNADFSQCITQGELEHALSSVTTKYTEADKVISAQTEQIAKRDYVGRFWRDEAGNICGEIFGNYQSNEASGNYSTARGDGTTASGARSTAEGNETTASGMDSHSEGSGTTASAPMAHSEGGNTEATGAAAHAEGGVTVASGQFAHSEGAGTVASGKASHSEGNDTEARGLYSHAEGDHTIAASARQHVSGKYNVIDELGAYIVIVGNGSSDTSRADAYRLDWGGNAWFAGNVTATINGVEISIGEIATDVNTAKSNISKLQQADTIIQTTLGVIKKNLLKNTAASNTKNGVTFTVNDDGSVMVNGTATADTELIVRNMSLQANTSYILTGCPTGGSVSTYQMYVMNTSTWSGTRRDVGSGATLATGDYTGWTFRIKVTSGYNANNLVFYPMLRYANITDGTFEPYVEDLQSQINALKVALAELLAATATATE